VLQDMAGSCRILGDKATVLSNTIERTFSKTRVSECYSIWNTQIPLGFKMANHISDVSENANNL
jgi:hypothetical protein